MTSRLASILIIPFFAAVTAAQQQQEQPGRLEPVPPPDLAVPDLNNPGRPFALMVGDPAPELDIAEWVLGDPIGKLERGKVYVVHFWSVVCEPCIEQMEVLTKLQNKRARDGLIVIGVTSQGHKNTAEAVKAFVFGDRTPIGYSIAWDRYQKALDTWIFPTGQTGIPVLFIIDQEGKIAFIGQWPQFEKTLDEVLEQTFDLEQAKRAHIDGIHAGARLQEAERLLINKDFVDAYRWLREIVDGPGWNSYVTLANLSWMIVDPKNKPEVQDLNLALRAARRADELTEGKDPDTIDTLARVYFSMGDVEKAIELQNRAIMLAPSESMKQRLRASLAEYELTRAP